MTDNQQMALNIITITISVVVIIMHIAVWCSR